MDRRSFFKSMVGGVAAAAAVRTFPFRVFSFPSEIKVAPSIQRVRFIRSFDILQNRMINRWDTIQGFSLLDNPPDLGFPDSIVTGNSVADVLTALKSSPEAEAAAYNELVRRQNAGIRGFEVLEKGAP